MNHPLEEEWCKTQDVRSETSFTSKNLRQGVSPLVLILAIAGSAGATWLAMSLMNRAESDATEFGSTVHLKTRASEAVRAVNGGSLTSLYSSTMTDRTLNELLPAAKMVSAELARSPISDAGVATLSKSKSLQEVILTQTRVSDACIPMLATLPELETLVLNSTEITDDGAVKLNSIPTLREVRLRRTIVGDPTANALSELRQLRIVGMSYTKITDAGVAQLCKLPELEELRLAGTSITDASLEKIAALPSLRRLDLADAKITDAGIAHLAASTTLSDLWVSRTGVTAEGLAAIRKLPTLTLLAVAGIKGEKELVASIADDKSGRRVLYVTEGTADAKLMSALEEREPPLFIRSVYEPNSVRVE